MKKLLLLLCAIPFLAASAQDCGDLFFSEYVEGSDNNKCLEIYNPTDEIIDLSQYWVTRYSNGSTVYDNGGKTRLEGFILPYSTFILVNGQTEDIDLGTFISPKCDPALQAIGTEVNGMFDGDYPSPTYMNGNDVIALFKDPVGDDKYSDFIPVDLFGSIADGTQEEDKGWTSFTQEWAYRNIYNDQDEIIGKDSTWISKYIVPAEYYWLSWTADQSLFRKKEVKHGVTENPDSFNVKIEWDTVPGGRDAWAYLNDHDCDCESGSGVINAVRPSDFYISPNPVTNSHFTLYTTGKIESVEILSITGQVLLYKPVTLINGRMSIPVNDFRSGIYFIRGKAPGDQVLVKKFIIQ